METHHIHNTRCISDAFDVVFVTISSNIDIDISIILVLQLVALLHIIVYIDKLGDQLIEKDMFM